MGEMVSFGEKRNGKILWQVAGYGYDNFVLWVEDRLDGRTWCVYGLWLGKESGM
jgi:hypothetical protein